MLLIFYGGSVYVRIMHIQSVPGGHSIGHSKHKNCICTCVLFRTVSEIELFHCTGPK
jgi:hypothetical protein